jgi:hypothetical protein
MKRNEKGQVLVLVALAIFVLLGFAALGIDVGFMYSVRHELQRSADAGALAGASAFIDTGPWSNILTDPAMVQAKVRALDFASRDNVVGSRLDPNSEITVTFPSQDNVQVTTQRRVNLFFARIFGKNAETISATAIAEVATASKKVKCLKPWGISFPWNDINLNGQYDPNEAINDTCPEGITDKTWYFCTGTPVQIKVSGKDTNTLPVPQQEPSHFFALDLGQLNNAQGCLPRQNSGASSYYDYCVSKCLDDCITVDSGSNGTGDPIPLQTGNIMGKTIDCAETLIGQDSNGSWPEGALHPESPLYPGPLWVDSPRVIRIPVYDPRFDMLSPGNDTIHVAEFAGMWIDCVVTTGGAGSNAKGTVYGRYIPISTLGQSGGGGGNVGSPNQKFLRLVK